MLSVSVKDIRGLLRQEYPDANDQEIENAAREARERLQRAAEEITGEEVQKELEQATLGNNDLYEETGMYGVIVMSQRDEHVCNACLDHDGTQYTMQEKKEKQPLPHDGCENEECRCHYLPIPDREAYLDSLDEEPDLSNLRGD